jgi:hypothetical protein
MLQSGSNGLYQAAALEEFLAAHELLDRGTVVSTQLSDTAAIK